MILNSLIKKLENLEFTEVNLNILQNLNIPNVKITEVETFSSEGYTQIDIEHKNTLHNIIIYDNDKIVPFLKDWRRPMLVYKLNPFISVDREVETIENEDYKICKLSQTDDFDYVIVDKES